MDIENQLKKNQEATNAKRVTPEALENNIKKRDFYVHPDSQLTICVLTLNNGFTVTGESACADPKMFNKEIAEQKAKEKIWPLMGYALKQELFLSGSETFADRLLTEKRELEDKLIKLEAFMFGNVQYEKLAEEDQNLLKRQRDSMSTYLMILRKRIKRVKV